MKCEKEKVQKKAIIAGGTGFIGSKVVKKLLELKNYKCYVLTRNKTLKSREFEYIYCDLNNLTEECCEKIIEKYGKFDFGIYLAANIPKVGEKKDGFLDSNINTLQPLIKFMEGFSSYIKKVVYASSLDVIGIPKERFYNENASLLPESPYGVAKLCGELYLKSISRKQNVNLVILRFSQVYGPDEPIVRVIPILLNASKNELTFNMYGDGNEKRRFLYIDDAVRSILLCLEKEKSNNKTYNVAGKSIDSIKDLIDIVEDVYKKRVRIRRVENTGFTYDNIQSIEKIEEELGFSPLYSLKDGIKKIFEVETNEIL
jgi:UDP-glucose 4-epimerase